MSSKSIIHALKDELRLLHYRRWIYLLGLAVVAGCWIAQSGTTAQLQLEHDLFIGHVEQLTASGGSLEEALSAPTSVRQEGDRIVVENSVKHQYLQLCKTAAALTPAGMSATALDLVTFVVLPLAMMLLGCYLATYDISARTGKMIATRRPYWQATVARHAALLAIAIAATALTVTTGWALGRARESLVQATIAGFGFPLEVPTSAVSLAVKAGISCAITLFFGVLGHSLGALTRAFAWPMVACALVLFVAPFLWAADPRNVVSVLSLTGMEFWGQFRMRPPIPLSTENAVLLLIGYLCGALAITWWRQVRRPYFP